MTESRESFQANPQTGRTIYNFDTELCKKYPLSVSAVMAGHRNILNMFSPKRNWPCGKFTCRKHFNKDAKTWTKFIICHFLNLAQPSLSIQHEPTGSAKSLPNVTLLPVLYSMKAFLWGAKDEEKWREPELGLRETKTKKKKKKNRKQRSGVQGTAGCLPDALSAAG